MKYEALKEEIKTIAEIAESVPEMFKERCFEVLLQNLLASVATQKPTEQSFQKPATIDQQKETPPPTSNGGAFPTPSQIKVFMQKTGTTADELAKVAMFEDNAVHFIQEPIGNKIAKGQIQWALLLALKRGIEKNVLEVDPEEVRSICQDKGFYDATNFSVNFKSVSAAKLFQGEMKKQGTAQKLSNDGLTELAKLIKELAARSIQ